MNPYEAAFEVGQPVRIAAEADLRAFGVSWQYHHRLAPGQFPYAGAFALVSSVAFYHGGDPLYELDGIPGIWHEACLVRVEGGEVDPVVREYFRLRRNPLLWPWIRRSRVLWLWCKWKEALRKLLLVYVVIAAIALLLAIVLVCWYRIRG